MVCAQNRAKIAKHLFLIYYFREKIYKTQQLLDITPFSTILQYSSSSFIPPLETPALKLN